MSQNRFPPGWDEDRVHGVIDHYEHQTDEQALVEDESAYEMWKQGTGEKSH